MPKKKATPNPKVKPAQPAPEPEEYDEILDAAGNQDGTLTSADVIDTDSRSPNVHKNAWEVRSEELAYENQKRIAHTERLSIGLYAAALRDGTTIRSTVAAVDISGGNAFWICYDTNAMIRIPLAEAFENLDKQLLDKSTADNVKRDILEGGVGASITFIVTEIVYSETNNIYYVTGSRVKAMQRIRSRYFGSRAVNPLKVGDIVKAQVISSGDYTCYVEFNGITARLDNKDISYKYIPNVRAMYPGGTQLDVMILAIGGTDKNPEIIVSGTRVEKKNLKSLHWRVNRGMSLTATVKSIRWNEDTKVLNISLYLDNVGLPAYANSTSYQDVNRITKGTKVGVRVDTIMQESGFVKVNIVQVLS